MSYTQNLPPGVSSVWTSGDEQYQFKAAWEYKKNGRVFGVAARFENTHKKIIIPCFKSNGNGFKPGAAPTPRPLYGLDTLDFGGPVLIPEGEKAACALHYLRLPAVASPGGSQSPDKADWSPLQGRDICILCDNDGSGHKYAAQVSEILEGIAANVSVVPIIQGTPKEEGADVVDWLMAEIPGWDGFGALPEGTNIVRIKEKLLKAIRESKGAILAQKRTKKKPAKAKPAAEQCPYVVNDQGTFHISTKTIKERGKEPVTIPYETKLANFSALIVEEFLLDDGAETFMTMSLEGRRGRKTLPRIAIPAEQFTSFSWMKKSWRGCIIEPGQMVKDRLRHAIETLSYRDGDPPFKIIYAHTGWRVVDGQHIFLMPGCAIGPEGPIESLNVELDGLHQYHFAGVSADDEQRRQAAEASMACLDAAPMALTVPLMSMTYLAPFSEALKVNFSLWPYGPSQGKKTSLCAVFGSHFGHMTHADIPAEWRDTYTRLELKLFAAKDTLILIDDYCPQGSQNDQARVDSAVHNTVRAIGNRKGRGRATSDIRGRPDKPPRAAVICTAEMLPSGESKTARIFSVPVEKGVVDLEKLSSLQASAAEGVLARCMADFILGVARDYGRRVIALKACFETLWSKAREAGLEDRTAEQAAFLGTGLTLAISHFGECGAIDQQRAGELIDKGWGILVGLGFDHQERIARAQPAEAFREALVDMLASGVCHVRDRKGDAIPPNRTRYGWDGQMPKGAHIGWVDETVGVLYLLKTTLLKEVREFVRQTGDPINLSQAALWKQLRDRGFLLPGDIEKKAGRYIQRSENRVRIGDSRIYVLTFEMRALGMVDEG